MKSPEEIAEHVYSHFVTVVCDHSNRLGTVKPSAWIARHLGGLSPAVAALVGFRLAQAMRETKAGNMEAPALHAISGAIEIEQRREKEPETLVIFRRWKRGPAGGGHGDVFALFPLLPETKPGECLSYEHVGQHGAANYTLCIRRSDPVDSDDADVCALRAELESIGYRLREVNRLPNWRKVQEARKAQGL